MGKKLTQEEFIERSNLNHNNKYDYSNTLYVNANKKVKIICREHGEFLQRAHDHLTKGCIKCYYDSRRSNTIDFVSKSKNIHGDKYDYSLAEYKSFNTKVKIICREHGEFLQTPNNHLNKQGCYNCKNNSQRSNLDIFIKRSKEKHGDKYDYSKCKYKNIRTDITITCKKHGDFLQKPNKHINGNGCPKCKIDNNILTNEEFVKKSISVHGDKYDYSKVEYKYNNKKVIIICREHGEFMQTPMIHLRESGCPKCALKFGLMENKWLDKFNIENRYRQFKIDKYIVDGYDSKANTIYEFNGDFWHGNPLKYKMKDINSVSGKTFGELYKNTIIKENNLRKLGYNIISIWESDFLKEETIS